MIEFNHLKLGYNVQDLPHMGRLHEAMPFLYRSPVAPT